MLSVQGLKTTAAEAAVAGTYVIAAADAAMRYAVPFALLAKAGAGSIQLKFGSRVALSSTSDGVLHGSKGRNLLSQENEELSVVINAGSSGNYALTWGKVPPLSDSMSKL